MVTSQFVGPGLGIAGMFVANALGAPGDAPPDDLPPEIRHLMVDDGVLGDSPEGPDS